MKKFYIILGVLACFVFIASPALADSKYIRNVDINRSGILSGNTDSNLSIATKGGKVYNGDITNNSVGGNKINTGGGNYGGDYDNRSYSDFNKNNDNQSGLINQKGDGTKQVGFVNAAGGGGREGEGDAQAQGQMQGQGQAQKQQQGQLQGQKQSQDNVSNNEGVSLEVNQNFEDKRDHITGPNVLQSDAKLSTGRAFKSKVYGAKMLTNIKELTVKQAKKLSSKASDITCEEALYMENEFSTNKVKCLYGKDKLSGESMGYLYMGSDGPDVNSAAMIGEAAEQAMKAGATHMKLVDFTVGELSEGSAWNIGLGGGASIMKGAGDSLAVAPNGGLGFGKAKAFNELRPEMVFELSFDKELASNYKLSKADHGWSASSLEVAQLR